MTLPIERENVAGKDEKSFDTSLFRPLSAAPG